MPVLKVETDRYIDTNFIGINFSKLANCRSGVHEGSKQPTIQPIIIGASEASPYLVFNVAILSVCHNYVMDRHNDLLLGLMILADFHRCSTLVQLMFIVYGVFTLCFLFASAVGLSPCQWKSFSYL